MAPADYTLYHNPFSICSIFVRYTLAMAGESRDADSMLHVHENMVDLAKQEQLAEDYLTKINPKGQVPVLTSSRLSAPIADSLDIQLFIADHYPTLSPDSHKSNIIQLLKELHALNYFSLSFGKKPQMAAANVKAIEDQLARKDISAEYRKALEYKQHVYALLVYSI
jgi:glutathione S-transferase